MGIKVARGPRQRAEVILSPHPDGKAHLLKMQFPFRRRFYEAIKPIPGCRYAGDDYDRGVWVAPANAVSVIARIAADHNMRLRNDCPPDQKPPQLKRFKGALPIQIANTKPALSKPAYMLPWEMGTGKTLAALMILKTVLTPDGAALISCPAIGRAVWESELQKWWRGHPPTRLITTVKAAKAVWTARDKDPPQIAITSHALLHHLQNAARLDAIILDESHHFSSASIIKSKAAHALRTLNPDARVLQLTGTPITNEPKNLHGQLDLLEPEGWGSWYKFCCRYCDWESNEFATGGKTFFGLSEEFKSELQERLSYISTRITKADIAQHLPPIAIQVIRLDGPKEAQLLKALTERSFSKAVSHTREIKIKYAIEWANETRTGGAPFALIFTHLNDTADAIADGLRDSDNVLVLSGRRAKAPEKRHSLLTQFQKGGSGTVVATMHSVGESVNNLTFISQVLFAELYYRPSTITQAISRVHRMTAIDPISIAFLIVKRTIDELILNNLRPKIEAIEELIRHGVSGKKLAEAIEGSQMNDAEFAKHIGEIADSYDVEDDYA